MAQPATAAAVIAAIFASLLVAYAAYKVYARVHHRRVQREQELPPIREPVSMYGQTLVSSGNSQAGTLYGTTEWPDGWKGSASRASLGTASHLNGYNTDSRRPSVIGYLNSPSAVAADASAPSSPLSPGADADLPTPPGETYDHLRGVSSSSSTMALKRSYAASSLRGSGTQSPIMSTRPRDSYLPHLPSNRESIHIVTPQPLGFGVGGMAQATDQKTLAFSKASGIGSTDDEFSSGLVWAAEAGASGGGSGGVNEFGAASSSRFGEEERMRYLAEGPNRTWSSASGRGPNSSPAASDVIMPGDSVSRSRSPATKSRTPSPANPARARVEDGATAHPLAVTAMDVRLGPSAGPSFIAQQSPLQMMSQRMEAGAPSPLPKDRQPASFSANGRPREHHHRVVSDADTLATAMSYGENGGRGSPILSGGFAAGAHGTPDRYPADLPALDSQSASGADSHSTPTGPSTATDGSTGRPSASASDRDAEGTTAANTAVVPSKDEPEQPSSPFGGRSFALGADGQLRMVGKAKDAADLEAGHGAAQKGRRGSSWLPSIIGGSA